MIFNMTGGGAPLNFKVVPNPQPDTAKENTIWVDTDRINNYYFSATQPEGMVDYDVWFPVGTSSTVEFNALKKGGIQVYPLYSKQMVSGALVEKTAKSYHGGKWVDWFRIDYYVKDGVAVKNFSGILRSGQTFSQTQNADHLLLSATDELSGGYAHSSKVDVTEYKKLVLYADITAVGNSSHIGVGPVLVNALNASSLAASKSNIIASKMTKTTGIQKLECNISTYSGSYYIGVYLDCGDSGRPKAKVYDFYLSTEEVE